MVDTLNSPERLEGRYAPEYINRAKLLSTARAIINQPERKISAQTSRAMEKLFKPVMDRFETPNLALYQPAETPQVPVSPELAAHAARLGDVNEGYIANPQTGSQTELNVDALLAEIYSMHDGMQKEAIL